MAEYKIHKKHNSHANVRKIVGISLITLSCLAFFFLLTNLWPIMQDFLLGTFGYFAYPLFIGVLLGGVALLNSTRYKLSKKYAIFLYLTIFFLLCIIQLAIVGDKSGSYGDYLALNYTRKHTIGGIIIGLFTTPILYLTGFVWSFVIFSVCFVICCALYIDALIYLKKNARQAKPVSLHVKEVKKVEPPLAKEEVNVTMTAHIENKKTKKQIALEKIGLVRRPVGEIVEPQPTQPQKQRVDPRTLKGKELKNYLLTPPEVNVNEYFSPDARSYVRNGVSSQPFKTELDKNISALKTDELPKSPAPVEDVQPEQLVSQADEIIREVIEEAGITPSEQPTSGENFTRRDDSLSRDRNDISRDRSDISRDRNDLVRDRDNLSRDASVSGRGEFNRDAQSFGRDNSSREEFIRSDANQNNKDFARHDGMRRDEQFAVDAPPSERQSRRFVDIDGEEEQQKEEYFPPYNYTRPPVDLITTRSSDMSEFDDDISTKTIILENTLQEFGVPAKVQNVVIGPAVTRYELEMPMGITVKKILNLSSDIALALEANGGDVRIEAPVPGRNVVGIEVPNDKVAMVSLRDVIISNEFNSHKSPLAYAVGKDITGKNIVGALNKMPHLLIAGTTGSGKSVMLNSIIISILYKANPDDCKLLLIDPKQVEFTPYEGIPHLIVPKVISDLTKATNALQWAVDEMERRFRLIREARVRDIEEYNQTQPVQTGRKKKMPFIVVIIDEFSDFIMQGKKEVEDKIVRLGQKARAAGIHLILATQYPTAEYVTGGIKANFPSRIAFKVASRVNSDVILGMTGAEKLLGHGDMLFAPQEYSSSPRRVQGCFITTKEIADIVSYVTLHNEAVFDQSVQDAINNTPKNGAIGEGQDRGGMDPLLPEALKICIDAGQASVSMIQRRLSIGYPRAGKIVDQMCEMGYISAADGAKPRNIYITLEEFYQIFGDNYE